jgi:hypothetical protein
MKKIFKELFELFVKSNKREPNAIEMLQLKFKASQKASQQVGKGEVIPFPPERITDWTKARPQPPEIEIIDGVQTTRGLGDLFERQMKNIGKKDPALYEDRGGNIIPAQFKDLTKDSLPPGGTRESVRKEAIEKYGIQPERVDEIMNTKFDEKLADEVLKDLDLDDALPNYKETPGEYSRRNTPGSIENLREEMKIAYRNEFDRLTGNETAEELKEILKNLDTDGVPFAEGGQARSEYSKGLKVKGSGSISGKQDMYSTGEKSAIKLPEGVTSDESFINLIANLDIPISKKISLLGDVQYNKFRNKIQKGDEELFLEDPASSIDRKIGIGFDSGTGTTGSAKYGIDDKGFMFEIKKNFAEGGPTSTGLNYLLGEDDTNSRVSYGAGGRRGFLKLLAGLGAAGAAFKTGLLGLTKGGGKKVATEVAKEAATGGAPTHFFKLVAKIKALGDESTAKYATKDREVVTRYKDYTLTEDITTGEKTIQRFKQSEADFYDEPLMEEVYMSHRPGEMTEGAGGKFIKTADEYTEDTSFLRTSRGNQGEVMDTVDGIPDDLLEELGETIVKKADGGRIGYAGGKKVVQGLISLLNKKAGKNVLTTADKLPIPKKTIDRDMFRQANNRLNKKRQLTDQEIQDYEMELGDSETWMSEGTVGEAENALKNQKAYQAEMYQQYKMGKLDPVAGDKSPARKRFLEQKFDEMESSGDPKLMTRDEIEELTFFDLGTEMDNFGLSSAEKKGKKLADSMSDAEIDLRDEFPGIEDRLIKQILTDDNPQRVAEVKQTMREALEMQNKGMSVDEIIKTFKGTTRTKQAEGGRMDLWLGGGLKAGKSLTREMLKFMSKGSTNAKSPKELLKLYNPKQFNRLLDNPLNTGKISPETGETADEMILDLMGKMKEDRADMVGDLIGSARRIKKVDDEILAYKNKIIKEMVDGGIDEKTASSFADLMAKEMKEGAAPLLTSSPPKITEQGLIELENIQKNLKTKGRKLNATGGLAHLLGE